MVVLFLYIQNFLKLLYSLQLLLFSSTNSCTEFRFIKYSSDFLSVSDEIPNLDNFYGSNWNKVISFSSLFYILAVQKKKK